MSSRELMDNPPFRGMIQAAPGGEIWTHTRNDLKMREFGWRHTNTENDYELGTLIGNWYEERRELEQLKIRESLPSQYAHYYNTMYHSSYNTLPVKTVPEVLKNLRGRHPHSYPHHQPELDGDRVKEIYNSWETTYRADYLNPEIRRQPVLSNDRIYIRSK